MQLVHMFLFFLLQPWFAFIGMGNHIDAESFLPSQLAAGETATGTWTIHKGDARGFARLHMRVPEHLNFTPIETAGASFEYRDGVVKLIWLDAPDTDVFQVKLSMEAQMHFAGGSFEPLWSFISDGKRQDVALPSAYIASASASLAGNPLMPEPKEWFVEGLDPAPVPEVLPPFDPDRFEVIRTVVIEAPEVALVKFTVTGHPKHLFLRLVDQLPEGCITERDVLMGASLRCEESEIAFQWHNAPRSRTFEVSYRLSGDLMTCLPQIQGYAEFPVGETMHAPALPAFDWSQVEDPQGWLETPALAAAEPEPAAAPEPAEGPVAIEVPAPDRGISFRVQVLAAHTHVDGKWFNKRFGYASTVDVEPHEDWIKYTTGSFDAYALARNHREQLAARYAFPGPFVTAYDAGERITVQEALVRAQQQWIP